MRVDVRRSSWYNIYRWSKASIQPELLVSKDIGARLADLDFIVIINKVVVLEISHLIPRGKRWHPMILTIATGGACRWDPHKKSGHSLDMVRRKRQDAASDSATLGKIQPCLVSSEA
jgi:hypothetical protein